MADTRPKDLTDRRFGKLVAKYLYPERTKDGRRQWFCECDCGNTCIVRAKDLISHNTQSCGCLALKSLEEKRKKYLTKHGGRNTRLYSLWAGIKRRCYNTNASDYYRYGGRGITVCDEWRHDFVSFRDWAMKNGYQDDLSIDRKNNDGPYSPDNCRWVTMNFQENNKRNNHNLTYDNETHTIADWARIVGIDRRLILTRILHGWTTEQALFIKPNSNATEVRDHNGFRILLPKIKTKSGRASKYSN